jgi:nucleoside-diphosphate-sugar epimerase
VVVECANARNKHAQRTSVYTMSERSFEASGAGARSGSPRWSGNGTPRQGAAVPRECANELSCYILRPAMIYGPGSKGNMNLLAKVVRSGIPWPLGAFENKRSFASVENVSRVLEALLTKDVEPGIYQVADDEPLSTNQLIEQIAVSLGRKPRIWKLPCGLMRGIARVGDLLHLPLNSERLKKLTESYVVSNKKLLKALGWEKGKLKAGMAGVAGMACMGRRES